MATPVSSSGIVLKIGMVGDVQVGKTSLMVRYVESRFDEDYIQTLGVNFMDKTVSIRSTPVTFSIWDLAGSHDFISMLPLVVNDSACILFMFDLTRKSTLTSMREWYRQVRGLNKNAFCVLVGTKFDAFLSKPPEYQAEITKLARRYARAMKGSVVFTSSSHSINVKNIFKIVIAKALKIGCKIEKVTEAGKPILEY